MRCVSEHRRTRSRHRDAPGQHRTLARGGRVGFLIAALATTGAVAFVGFGPYTDAEPSSAAQHAAPSAEETSLLDGVGGLADAEGSSGDDASETETLADVPPKSGSGRRVVFDMSGQRVWIVSGNDKVRKTYLVSGSRSDNLQPGRYRVFSRSRLAVETG